MGLHLDKDMGMSQKGAEEIEAAVTGQDSGTSFFTSAHTGLQGHCHCSFS